MAFYNQLAGSIRLVQHRVRRDSCQVIEFGGFFKKASGGGAACYGEYSEDNRETGNLAAFERL